MNLRKRRRSPKPPEWLFWLLLWPVLPLIVVLAAMQGRRRVRRSSPARRLLLESMRNANGPDPTVGGGFGCGWRDDRG